MIERTIVAALVMGCVGFGAFWWMLRAGWTEGAARNALLLLMVLFENVHLGNCRSETKSALRLSPFRSPILLGGSLIALLLHVGMMFTPLGTRGFARRAGGPDDLRQFVGVGTDGICGDGSSQMELELTASGAVSW